MKIGVLSDTHIPIRAQDLSKEVYALLEKVDLILHAGDLVHLGVLERLKQYAPVRAVYGNMDYPEVRNVLPKRDIIECGGFRIGLFHGYGLPNNLLEKAKAEFNEEVNTVVFGHSHIPVNETINGVLFFNPGSPTDDVFSPYKSIGLLEVNEKIIGQIIKLKS